MHEALFKLAPSVLIDTHGQSFGYYLAWCSGIKVISYVHYPVISTDMIQKVREMRPAYNNSSKIATTVSVSYLKLAYYKILLAWYSTSGLFCRLALCNSTWTFNHISNIWRCPKSILYPPCDVNQFLRIPLDSPKQEIVISIGQFRPEKDHELQILAMKEVTSQPDLKNVKLVLVGSCRDQGDQDRVTGLKNLASSLKLDQNVEFFVNVSYEELLRLVGKSMVGLHTMWNEHFGICVVELMASGLITVAHNSAGPKEDIVSAELDGFLATTAEEYSRFISQGIRKFKMLENLRVRAREKSKKFSQSLFEQNFIDRVKDFLK